MTFFSPPPDAEDGTPAGGERIPEVALQAVGLRRVRFMARFIYWTWQHKSTANVRWVLAYEGYSWN